MTNDIRPGVVYLDGRGFRRKLPEPKFDVVYLRDYDPNQPRDEQGRWTDTGGGGGASGSNAPSGSPPSGEGSTAVAITDEERIRRYWVVRQHADNIADQMDFDPSRISVSKGEPEEFQVGDQLFRMRGHYEFATGQIEINALSAYDERPGVTDGVVSHEIMHAMHDTVHQEQEREHESIRQLPIEERDRLFPSPGYPNPELIPELKRRFPVSYMFGQTIGDDWFGGPSPEVLARENGVSSYSHSYWNAPRPGKHAIQETLAETARYYEVPTSWNELRAPRKNSAFSRAYRGIRKAYKDLQK